MERDVLVGSTYRHVSGNYYRVIAIAKSTEEYDGVEPKEMVVYESLGADRTFWVRSLSKFNEKVDQTKNPDCVQKYRFELVDDKIEN